MKLALALVACVGCTSIQKHPLVSIAVANSGLVVASGACAIECSYPSNRISDGVLIGELAIVSLVGAAVVETIVLVEKH